MTGRRANETTRPRDDETTRLRNDENTERRDDRTAEKHRRSQAFSVILSHSQLCEAVRGSLVSEWCRCGASQKRVPRDSTKTYSPWYFTFWDVPQMRRYHAKQPLIGVPLITTRIIEDGASVGNCLHRQITLIETYTISAIVCKVVRHNRRMTLRGED